MEKDIIRDYREKAEKENVQLPEEEVNSKKGDILE